MGHDYETPIDRVFFLCYAFFAQAEEHFFQLREKISKDV